MDGSVENFSRWMVLKPIGKWLCHYKNSLTVGVTISMGLAVIDIIYVSLPDFVPLVEQAEADRRIEDRKYQKVYCSTKQISNTMWYVPMRGICETKNNEDAVMKGIGQKYKIINLVPRYDNKREVVGNYVIVQVH